MIVPKDGLLNMPFAISDAGCYEILLNDDLSGNILYTDIQTRQRIYLSEALSSSHHSESDTSWIENLSGGCSTFVMGETLFIHPYGSDDTPGSLYKAQLNGQNRVKLVDFIDYSSLCAGIACDGEYLYTLSQNKALKQCIIRINIDTGKIDEYTTLPTEAASFIVTAFDDCLIIKTITVEENMDSADAVERFRSQIHRLYKYSLSDGSLSELTYWQQNSIQETYDERYIYCFDIENDSLFMLNAETGEQEQLISSLTGVGVDHLDIASVGEVFDSHILFSTYDRSYITIDLKSKEVKVLKSIDDEGTYPYILGVYEDIFLITYGNLEVLMDSTDPDGSPMKINVIMSRLALIDKEDYWNSDYTRVEEIENVFLNDRDK